jgi:hypothetical protein
VFPTDEELMKHCYSVAVPIGIAEIDRPSEHLLLLRFVSS